MLLNFYILDIFLLCQGILLTNGGGRDDHSLSLFDDDDDDVMDDIVEISLPGNDPKDFQYLISGGNRDKEVLRLARFLISLRTRRSREFFGDDHFCMGTIISKRAILTASHCVMDKKLATADPRFLSVVAGTPNRIEQNKETVVAKINKIIPHPHYRSKRKDDIAIIQLKKALPIDGYRIDIMKLPRGPLSTSRLCYIIGWGRIFKKGPYAALPMTALVNILNQADCLQIYGKDIPNGMLCAGVPDDYLFDVCRGDTGGPLICNNTLTAVTSSRVGCGQNRTPSLYTDVWHVIHWIRKNHSPRRINPDTRMIVVGYCGLLLMFIWFQRIH